MQRALVTVILAIFLAPLANFRQFDYKAAVKVGVSVKLDSRDSLGILDVMKVLSKAGTSQNR